VAAAEWPCLFHGGLDVELPLPRHERGRPTALLRFGSAPEAITAVHLLCRYRKRRPPT
jgi:hypothetical protein